VSDLLAISVGVLAVAAGVVLGGLTLDMVLLVIRRATGKRAPGVFKVVSVVYVRGRPKQEKNGLAIGRRA